MTEEDKKAIEFFKEIIKQTETANECGLSTNDFSEEIKIYKIILNLIQKLQEENKKKDKIIDLMTDKLVQDIEWFYSEFDNYTKEDFRQYFEKKVSDGDE